MMQGIDISSHQTGIDLAAVPCDFAIVKATEGAGYVNPDCDRAMQQLFSLGKPAGFYHYVNGDSGEIDYFINNTRGYIGRAVICLDWERGGNGRWGDESYLAECIEQVKQLTGISPIVYASAGVFPWGVCADHDCGTWVAQYGSMDATGYQDSPWNSDAYNCTMRQYASTGRLPNWGGNLDLDLFYGDSSAWNAYATGGKGALSMDASQIIQEWDGGRDGHSGLYTNVTDADIRVTRMKEILDGWNDGIDGHDGIYTNVLDADVRIQKIQAEVEALSAAIKALAEMKGGDPDAVAKAVSDAVEKKLEGLRFSVKED